MLGKADFVNVDDFQSRIYDLRKLPSQGSSLSSPFLGIFIPVLWQMAFYDFLVGDLGVMVQGLEQLNREFFASNFGEVVGSSSQIHVLVALEF